MTGEITKRIRETKHEIFPLDRFLPLNSVFTIFYEEYEKQKNDEDFFKRKFQRLREAYYGLFTALAHSIKMEKEHFLVFPSDPANDLYIAEVNRDSSGKAYQFDVKEYTEHSTGFPSFLERSVFPRLSQYDVILGLHIGVSNELQIIYDHLNKSNSQRMIYVIGANEPNQINPFIMRVIAISKNGVFQDTVLDLTKYLIKLDTAIVFQDLVKFRQSKNFDGE